MQHNKLLDYSLRILIKAAKARTANIKIVSITID